jgi:hypothetical protein
MTFSRKFRPIVEKWNNDKVGRVEIQTFAHKSNNRKTKPLASALNAMEILKIQAPEIFDLLMEILHNCLSVITHMFPDPQQGRGRLARTHPARLDPTPRRPKSSRFWAGLYPGIVITGKRGKILANLRQSKGDSMALSEVYRNYFRPVKKYHILNII